MQDELILCEGCNTMKHPQIDGIDICGRCWPKYAEENGLCVNCGSELEPIYENNGFTEPAGPSHWEITGYKPCTDCSYYDAGDDL